MIIAFHMSLCYRMFVIGTHVQLQYESPRNRRKLFKRFVGVVYHPLPQQSDGRGAPRCFLGSREKNNMKLTFNPIQANLKHAFKETA